MADLSPLLLIPFDSCVVQERGKRKTETEKDGICKSEHAFSGLQYASPDMKNKPTNNTGTSHFQLQVT